MLKPNELIFSGRPVSLSNFNLQESNPSRIMVCPNPPQEAVAAGHAIAVPAGEFSVERVKKQLPAGFQPEMIHISARNLCFRPIGLNTFGCPTVMKLGDTFHQGDGTLSAIMKYCQWFQCDYHWSYQGVHHLHFFAEAGLKNVFWLPGSIVIDPYTPAPPGETIYDVVFRGSRSEFHARRTHLVEVLQQQGIALDVATKPYIASLEDYTRAKIVFNCSLNGDVNRRVLEVPMAGGFLLTDRLSPQTGLSLLFQEGVHLECYGNEQELLEKIRYYLAHPEEAAHIAAAGQKRLLEDLNQNRVRSQLYDYILAGKLDPRFTLAHDRRAMVSTGSDRELLPVRIKLYEVLQEIHRINTTVQLLYWNGRCKALLSDLADLIRLEITYVSDFPTAAKTWCDETGVSHRVQFLDQRSAVGAQQRYPVVLIDCPDSSAQLTEMLETVVPLVATQGLLLVVGQPPTALRQQLNAVLKSRGLRAVHLEMARQTWEPEAIPYSAYQNSQNSHGQAAPQAPALHLNPMGVKDQVLTQVKGFPLIRKCKSAYLSLRG